MKKIKKLYLAILTFGMFTSVAQAQNESASRMPALEGTAIEYPVLVKTSPVVVMSKEVVTPAVVESKVVETPQVVAFKNLAASKKIVKGERIKKNLKPEQENKVNATSKILVLSIVLIILGVILAILVNYTLGILLLVLGVLLLVLDLLDVI